MSRCLGDLLGHRTCGLIAEPDVFDLQLKPHDQVLLVCSDGIWEFVTAYEAVKLVSDFTPAQAMAAAEKLARLAWDRWVVAEGGTVVDDMTVVLVYLRAARQGLRPCPGARAVASRSTCVRTVACDRMTRGTGSVKAGRGQWQVPQRGAWQPL
jgi:serine/threonine protein phosphatase PrpC